MENAKPIPPKENKMGTMPIGRLLMSMSTPMMISMLVQAFYNVVDSVFVSRLGENALNAVSLAFPLQQLMIAVCGGTAVGMNALLSRSLGAKQFDRANKIANTGIFLFLCSSAVFTLIGIFLSKPFFLAQTDVKEIVDYGTDYASVCLGCSIGICSQFCFEKLLQSTGKTTHSMIAQLIGAAINIILDPILVFGLLGMPRLEVLGAAIATVSGQIVAAIVAIIFNIKFNKEIHISSKLIRFDKAITKDIYKIGLPSIVMQSIGSVMTFTMNKILIGFTTTATAVFGSYFKLQSFVFMPIFGLNNGMVPIIAYNYGAKRYDRVKKTITLSIVTAVSIMFIGLLAFELIPHVLLSFFNASEDMLRIGVPALRIIGTHYIFAGFCIIAGSVCQAIGKPVYSLIVSVCRQLVVLLPSAWLLSLTGRLELVWFAFPIAECFSLVLSTIYLSKTMRRAKEKMKDIII
ncbi:MAG: MATE family efflux transporter [Clostridia bacterium]|nr:MATE family efflux transporter [Clostridia bacterium]